MTGDELICRRVFRAPRELVWRCLTEPAELARFWGPRGTTTPVGGIIVELRPGGRFETLMTGEGGSYRMAATFTEIIAPERLCWIEAGSGMHTTSTLRDLGDGTTEVVIVQRHVPEALRLPQARAGFLSSLDKLEEHLAYLMKESGVIMTETQPSGTQSSEARSSEAQSSEARSSEARSSEARSSEARSWVAATYLGLAGLLDGSPAQTWDAQSLCEKWLVRHVVAHVTMPARFTPERFGAEMAAAGGDFAVLSDAVASRDGSLPAAELLGQLRSAVLHQWEPPGGGLTGALSHAVIHSLDVTLALGVPPVAPAAAMTEVLAQLAAAGGAWFGIDLSDVRLEASDTGWSWGTGQPVRAGSGSLTALVSGRALPGGLVLPRR